MTPEKFPAEEFATLMSDLENNATEILSLAEWLRGNFVKMSNSDMVELTMSRRALLLVLESMTVAGMVLGARKIGAKKCIELGVPLIVAQHGEPCIVCGLPIVHEEEGT
jgi:hypothetical protein